MIEDTIERKPNGRYALGERELTCGDCVQLYAEQLGRGNVWLHGRIEHDHQGYYFVGVNRETEENYLCFNLADGMLMRCE